MSGKPSRRGSKRSLGGGDGKVFQLQGLLVPSSLEAAVSGQQGLGDGPPSRRQKQHHLSATANLQAKAGSLQLPPHPRSVKQTTRPAAGGFGGSSENTDGSSSSDDDGDTSDLNNIHQHDVSPAAETAAQQLSGAAQKCHSSGGTAGADAAADTDAGDVDVDDGHVSGGTESSGEEGEAGGSDSDDSDTDGEGEGLEDDDTEGLGADLDVDGLIGDDDEFGVSGSSDGEVDSDDDDDGSGKGGRNETGKFTEGSKGLSFAKAFSKILGKSGSTATLATGGKADSATVAAAAATDGVASSGAVTPAAILAGSKSLAKKKADEKAATLAGREARKARHELRTRGHVTVPVRGKDPAHDLREKTLTRMATRGVVLLFNAVAQAQKSVTDAAVSASKAPKLSKAAFLAQLKAGGATAAMGATATTATATAAAAPAALAAVGAGIGGVAMQASGGAPGWKVLQEGYTGLAGGQKMKDWDKVQEADSDMDVPELEAKDSSDDGGDDGW